MKGSTVPCALVARWYVNCRATVILRRQQRSGWRTSNLWTKTKIKNLFWHLSVQGVKQEEGDKAFDLAHGTFWSLCSEVWSKNPCTMLCSIKQLQLSHFNDWKEEPKVFADAVITQEFWCGIWLQSLRRQNVEEGDGIMRIYVGMTSRNW